LDLLDFGLLRLELLAQIIEVVGRFPEAFAVEFLILFVIHRYGPLSWFLADLRNLIMGYRLSSQKEEKTPIFKKNCVVWRKVLKTFQYRCPLP
jgi:hypothetical protein